MQTYNCSKGQNPNYVAYISCESLGMEIMADIPEQFSISVQNDFESRLPYSLADAFSRIPLLGGVAENIQAVSGLNAQFQDLSYQMWMGTTPLEFSLTLLFDAENSAIDDVFKPINALMGMALPGNQGVGPTTVLTAPGPIRGGTSGDGSVTIRVGRMFTFEHCAIVSATENIESRLEKSGYPIAAELEVTIRTGMVYGKADWLKAAGFGSGL